MVILCVSPEYHLYSLPTKNNGIVYKVQVKPIETAPVLDGFLSKNEWSDSAVISNFTQKEPTEGEPVSETTFILITYDDSNIYFGIRCFDKNPELIVANEMRRDYDLSENDYVEILIDTFHDQRNAYYFATNSLGARLDGEIKTEGMHINWDWNGIWKSKAQKDAQGWTAEIAISFQTLRFNNTEDLTWGINFGRYIPRKREESFWSPISRDDDFDDFGKFRVSKFGTLKGLQNIRQNNKLQIKPYSIGGFDYLGNNKKFNRLADLGLDTKVNITPNVISNITLNTDFAQVEADVEQINLSRFNLFFPEKRDFFIEGHDVFNVGEEGGAEPVTLLFHSRRIGLAFDNGDFQEIPIVGGIKTTGKTGDFELGLINVFTQKKHLSNNTVPETNFSALRVKKDVFKRSSIGFMALNKEEIDSKHFNRTFAMDGNLTFDNNFNLSGYYAKTFSPGLKNKDYNGFVEASFGSDKYYVRSSFTDIGKNFNPEMGFIQWQDIRKYNLNLTVSPRPKFFKTRQTHISYALEYIENHKGELQYRTFQPSIFNIFKNESFIFLGLNNFYDNIPAPGFFLGSAFIPAGIYKYNVAGLTYSSDQSRRFANSIQLGGGSFYDGTFWGINFENSFKPKTKLSLDLSWRWNRIDVPFPNGKFTTNILSSRLNYSFSPDLFVKTFSQWNHFDRLFKSNILLHHIFTVGSDFYVVYNIEWDTNQTFSSSLHTVLAKFTYLLNW